MIKIFISGASGFVGKNLWKYLAEDRFSLTALTLRGYFDATMVTEADAIIHLAGKAHDLKHVSKSEEYYRINYELTRKIYDAFLISKATKFIFLSSVKAVADEVTTSLHEQVLPEPQTHYGKSKLMAEQYIQSRPLPAGKSYYILRPCMVHGPGNKGNLNLLYKMIRAGLPYPLVAFRNKRSFLAVENLCFVIKELLLRIDIPQGVYNVADDQALSTKQVIEIIGEVLRKPPLFVYVHKNIVRHAARIGDILHLPFNSERLKKMTENYVVDNHTLTAFLHKSLPVDSEAGLRKTIQSFIDDH